MATATLSVPIVGSGQLGDRLQRLSDELEAAGRGDLVRKMRRHIRVAANPVMADLRRAVMHVEVASSKNGMARPHADTQLRARIARAIEVRTTRRGIKLVVNARKVGAYGETLPKYLDATITMYRRWRVRVFGRDIWVTQYGQPWWFVTITQRAPTIRRAVLQGLDEFARELAR